ncbi:fimbrial protein [Stenotrophomonas maltophilia]|uniref:Fimbrial protein n=1 Tax=Stenotrophomonas maltophilia TaxID=40324 RepID=A0A270NIJ0_STEMA|nr:fimbrial protein [Stenotrophomonas maltophilia]PAM64690.1 fimbrial protein [Stenotrophomonas maltophilia]PAM71847.1 fimbrial protein [Stenotrophomonas maltophilia]PAM71856.1 fimbrial protein [Stenotrophomonas maltophilia]
MNTASISLAIALAAATFAPAALAADTLTINGEVLASTCTVGNNGSVTVPMGKLDLASLQSNNKSSAQNFKVTLDCAGVTGSQDVAVKFSGMADADGNLKVTPGGASAVAYRIEDASGNQLKINDMPTEFVTVSADAAYDIDYTVWFTAEAGGTPTAGVANATAQMDVVYK